LAGRRGEGGAASSDIIGSQWVQIPRHGDPTASTGEGGAASQPVDSAASASASAGTAVLSEARPPSAQQQAADAAAGAVDDAVDPKAPSGSDIIGSQWVQTARHGDPIASTDAVDPKRGPASPASSGMPAPRHDASGLPELRLEAAAVPAATDRFIEDGTPALLTEPAHRESLLRVHWVAVPKALRARRVNRCHRVGGAAEHRGIVTIIADGGGDGGGGCPAAAAGRGGGRPRLAAPSSGGAAASAGRDARASPAIHSGGGVALPRPSRGARHSPTAGRTAAAAPQPDSTSSAS
jgi:hypothetical protein